MIALTNKIPRLQLFALCAAILFVLIQTILRGVFWIRFHNPLDPIDNTELLRSFYLGLKYDMQVSVALVIPILLLGWIKPLHPVYSDSGRRLWLIYIMLAVAGLLAIFATDFGHYAYLEQRLNATALRFLENLAISATMVWQTYPVISGSLLLIAITALLTWGFARLTSKITPIPDQYGRWYKKTGVVIITIIVVFAGLYAKLSWYPFRWSDAFFSTHAFTGQLTTNPVLYFFNTLKNKDETYNLDATRDAYPLMSAYLAVDNPDIDKLDYKRSFTYNHNEDHTPANVIIVILESFASYKSGLSGNPLNSTPNLDRLAREGYFFPNFYVTQTGTARSMWTFLTGIPDIELNKTSSRNPLIVDQHTIVKDFKDHQKFYFLGGSASWANIRGLFANNIPGLKIFEEGSYESPRVDVWGISDLSLFQEANNVLKNVDGPFFAVIQTSGNHRPYTIPEDNNDFEILREEDINFSVTDYGFASVEELNSFRFMDHSIGEFMKLAEEASYSDNTLFVFFGDHGIHAQTGRHSPASEEQLRISGLRVPLVMYGKGLITEPGIFNKVASQVDVLSTVASITQTDYTDTTMGRDLLNTKLDEKRYAFTIEHGGGRVIGLLSDEYYLQMKYDGSNIKLNKLDSETPRDDISAQHPEIVEEMSRYLGAMRDTIKYMRENNKPEDISPANNQ